MRNKFVSISVKNMLLLTALNLVLVVGSGSALYSVFNRIFYHQVMSDMEQIMIQNATNLDQILDSISKATLLLYTDKTIVDNIAASDISDPVANYNKKDIVLGQLAKYIYVPLHDKLTSYQITFFVADSQPLAHTLSPSDASFAGLYTDKEVSSESWYQQTWSQDGILCWFQDPEQPNHFFVSRLIKYLLDDPKNDQNTQKINLGVLVLKFDMNQLMAKLEPSKMTESSEFLVLDNNFQTLYGENDALRQAVVSLAEARGNHSESFQSGSIAIDNASYSIHARKLTNGWMLIGATPDSEISSRLSIVKSVIVRTALIAIAAGILLSLFLSFRISQPIRRLALTMRKVHNQDNIAQMIVPKTGNDEVGILYSSFHLMMHRIDHLLEESYKMAINEKEAEFKALQAQINPHFLYNTLDSINWMAMKLDAKQITNVVSSLSNLLRYAISNSDQLVPITEEIEQVRQYIVIQSICYSQPFSVFYDIDSTLDGHKMPRLILQPLVENAILHGAGKVGGDGRLGIMLYAEGDTLRLAVSSGGDGQLAGQLNDYLQGSLLFRSKPDGNGIRNVNQRIKLKFGDMYGLSYESDAEGSIKAIVSMPLKSVNQASLSPIA
ncbi:sensor histidine kinase [Cohnella fermenti]|uniref:Sensor histidine kinase n=1 Tax=Cohnella fermenti TaxID=2565925 RepID=A0A4S4BUT8_9BACL|nr:sensor histidine kinase [Cohnella fermenti]THF76704.1 sensor histidine kinase [Cohnella fermenti]